MHCSRGPFLLVGSFLFVCCCLKELGFRHEGSVGEDRPRVGRIRRIRTDQIRVNPSNPPHPWSIHSIWTPSTQT